MGSCSGATKNCRAPMSWSGRSACRRRSGRRASTRSSSTPTTSARPASLISPASRPIGPMRCCCCPRKGRRFSRPRCRSGSATGSNRRTPTAEVAHSPQPGRLIGERLAAGGARKVGVVELDHMPGGLIDEIRTAAPSVALVDASGVFASVRAMPNAAELRLAAKADAIAAAAFAQAPAQPKLGRRCHGGAGAQRTQCAAPRSAMWRSRPT